MSKLSVKPFLKARFGFFIGLLFLMSCSPEKKKEVETSKPETEPGITLVKTSKAEVFTTAHKTDLKLSKSSGLNFGDFKQPLETEIDVLVDPSKQFQTFMGIGAALTDAAAETFYKLSEENQERFLEAYYSKENGIGYSL